MNFQAASHSETLCFSPKHQQVAVSKTFSLQCVGRRYFSLYTDDIFLRVFLGGVHTSFVLSIPNITQTQNIKPEETFISSAPIPLKQPLKKAFLRGKGLACLSSGTADTSSSPPQKWLFERGVLAKPKPAPWGRLSLLTFFDEAKKVSCPCGNEAQSKQLR
ncbi:MAG: hypothetical protein Q4G42_02290 [Neisseria sp.]|nr:hypothetical protein [Neisseria sp.]